MYKKGIYRWQDNAVKALLIAQRRDPLMFYSPSPKQKIAHEMMAHKSLILAGNGFGKSYWLAVEIAMALTGRHWVEDKYPKPPLDARLCSEKQALYGGGDESNGLIPMLKRYLAPYLKPTYPRKNSTAIECDWQLTNGSSLDILTYEQDDKAFESVSKHAMFFDEPFRESIYKASVARMRRGVGGRICMVMTPLLHAGWMFDRFISDDASDNDRAEVLIATIWDNCKCMSAEDHDGQEEMDDYLDVDGHCTCNGGYIHKQAINRMIAEYDQEEIDARVFGKFIVMRDRVFPSYSGDVHVLSEDLTPAEVAVKEMKLYVGIDPHQRRPPAWGLYGVDKDDIVYILDEFPNVYKGHYKTPEGSDRPMYYDGIKNCQLGYEQLIQEFYNSEKYWGGNVVKRWMDPRHAQATLPNTNEFVIDAFRRTAREQSIDMRFYPAIVGRDSGEGEIGSGVKMIRELLKYDEDKEIGVGNMPGLFINPSCENHKRMFAYAKYKTRTGKSAEGRAPSEEIEEKFKDFMDCFRYFVKSRPKTRQKGKSTYRPEYKPFSGFAGGF